MRSSCGKLRERHACVSLAIKIIEQPKNYDPIIILGDVVLKKERISRYIWKA